MISMLLIFYNCNNQLMKKSSNFYTDIRSYKYRHRNAGFWFGIVQSEFKFWPAKQNPNCDKQSKVTTVCLTDKSEPEILKPSQEAWFASLDHIVGLIPNWIT